MSVAESAGGQKVKKIIEVIKMKAKRNEGER